MTVIQLYYSLLHVISMKYAEFYQKQYSLIIASRSSRRIETINGIRDQFLLYNRFVHLINDQLGCCAGLYMVSFFNFCSFGISYFVLNKRQFDIWFSLISVGMAVVYTFSLTFIIVEMAQRSKLAMDQVELLAFKIVTQPLNDYYLDPEFEEARTALSYSSRTKRPLQQWQQIL